MSYINDNRIVLTLDAGGTNFVFSAMQGSTEIVENICLPSCPDNIDKCLSALVDGFSKVLSQLPKAPVAISFAFPGPADYPNGIIGGNLPNFPAFRQGVALGPFLQEKFKLPVFINNDGDLYAYGEAIGGFLPAINEKLAAAGSVKRYKNLLGLTLGTGFGGGIVVNNELVIGDNACSSEIFSIRNHKYPKCIVEESVSLRAIKRVYEELSGLPAADLTPKDIEDIAAGIKDGNKEAALTAYAEMGTIAGEAIANVITMLDGLVVIGGGISKGQKYFLPALVNQLNSQLGMMDGTVMTRIPQKVYNLEDAEGAAEFLKGDARKLQVYGTDKYVDYDPVKRVGVAISTLGASKAIMIGAYAYALNEMDKQA